MKTKRKKTAKSGKKKKTAFCETFFWNGIWSDFSGSSYCNSTDYNAF